MSRLRYILCLMLLPTALRADWYAGDLCQYDATQPRDHMAHLFQEAHEIDLDWRLLYNAPGTGAFIGLQAFLAEDKYNDPRQLVPLLGSGWQKGVAFVGTDPRAPIPQASFQTLQTWTTPHNGLIIITHPAQIPLPDVSSAFPLAFQGISQTGWHPMCEPGAQWDSLLTAKHRLTLVGSSAFGTPNRPVSRTYVYAESLEPQHLLDGLRKGATYVAEADGIHLNFRVNDRVSGARISVETDVIVKIRAAANHPISDAYLIANGNIIWQTQPNQTRWQTHIRIQQKDYQYIRLVLESKTGGYRTLSNPVYFEDPILDPIIPTSDISPDQNIHLAIDSMIESMATLPEPTQNSILSEYLGSIHTRYPTTLVLEHREDLIGDHMLEALITHPNPQIRLGAAFALVVRTPPELLSHLFTLINDPHQDIAQYAARMIYQYAQTQDETPLQQALKTAHPNVQNYLIRSLNPSNYQAALIGDLIHIAGQSSPTASAAAVASLTEFGNRSFRVINTLRDSAFQNHVRAVEILGLIADPRLSEDLHKIYRNAPGGPLRRASFIALQKLNAPYPDRPEILCPPFTTPPKLDATITPQEWSSGSYIQNLTTDYEAASANPNAQIWIGRDATRLLIAAQYELPDTMAKDTQIELSLSPSPQLDIPFVFTIPYPQTHTLTPIDPLLHIAQIVNDQTWTFEAAISLSDLGVDPDTAMPYLRFNIALKTQHNRWAWTPTYGHPDNPDYFGDLYINPVTSHSSLPPP